MVMKMMMITCVCVGPGVWLMWPYHFNVSDEVCYVCITYLLDIHCKNDFDAC